MENTIKFCGLTFNGLDHSTIFQESGQVKFVLTVNSEFIVKAYRDKAFSNLISSNHATFDGQIPYFFAKLVAKGLSFKKISGSDLIYDACLYAKNHKKRVFLLGGDAESNRLSVLKLRENYGIEIDGFSPCYSPYPFSVDHDQNILNKIIEYKPDYLFVSFGTPKQEYWIRDHVAFLQQQNVKMVVGCGGTFDFVSGRIKRAPRVIQKVGLEGIWRLLSEPKLFRLKRVLVSLKFFPIFYNYHIAKTLHIR